MELQRILKDNYLYSLKQQVLSGESLPLYDGETFEVDSSQTHTINIYAPQGLAEKMDPTDDFKSAVALFEEYKGVTPLIATMESFWAYVTHTDLFEYTKKRWQAKSEEEEKRKNNIIDHWFIGPNGVLRNAVASLWWSIYLTTDEEREYKYELSRIFFKNETVRVRVMGTTLFIRHREAMVGLLSFLADNPEISEEHFENRGRYISLYINRLGAVKQLSGLDRNFFRKTCENIKDDILAIKTRDDLKKKALLY